jgi:hypothetical protein
MAAKVKGSDKTTAASITTDDCKEALAAAWQYEGDGTNTKWKRLSKKGNKKSGIVRVFHHDDLPVRGTVTEEDGKIAKVEFKILGPWDVEDPDGCGMFDSEEGEDFLTEYLGPEDFVFFVSDTKCELSGCTWFVVTPFSYWKTAGCQYDEEMTQFIDCLLPPNSGEMSSGNFSSDMEAAPLRDELLRLGFIQDPEFDKFMTGT